MNPHPPTEAPPLPQAALNMELVVGGGVSVMGVYKDIGR